MLFFRIIGEVDNNDILLFSNHRNIKYFLYIIGQKFSYKSVCKIFLQISSKKPSINQLLKVKMCYLNM